MTTPALATGSGAALRLFGLALLGSWALAASAQVSVPMWPVPATMQTAVVLLLGALGGPWFGAGSVALYLAQGALGLPVFANGGGGIAHLAGPTGGFLLGFLAAAWVAGHAGAGWLRAGAVLLAAHLLLFVPGVLWLSQFVGLERAWQVGFVAFLPGTLAKTAIALVLLRTVRGGLRARA
jgi:biotin transport system substrate-specific component